MFSHIDIDKLYSSFPRLFRRLFFLVSSFVFVMSSFQEPIAVTDCVCVRVCVCVLNSYVPTYLPAYMPTQMCMSVCVCVCSCEYDLGHFRGQ